MPWHIEDDHPDCDGFAVVKDSTGDVVPGGCHNTEDEAQSHLAALVLSEENGNRAMEHRSYELQRITVRQEDGNRQISGYAAVFDRLSLPLFGFREKIAPGAFRDSLGADVRALWQHNNDQVLGRTRSGTLRLWEDERGLGFELDLPDTQTGRDAAVSIERGDVDQMSFGFIVRTDQWDEGEDDNDEVIRTLIRVNLIEISPVTFPAYQDTQVDVLRTAPEWVQRALAQDGVDHNHAEVQQSRARLAHMRRKLDVQRLHGG